MQAQQLQSGSSVGGCLQAGRKRKKPLTIEALLDFDGLARWMEQQLSDLQIGYQVTKQEEGRCMQYHCTAVKKTWCHQRRKRRLLKRLRGHEGGEMTQKLKTADDNSEEGTCMADAHSTRDSVDDGDIEALYAPCSMQFSCTIAAMAEVGGDKPHLKKPAHAQTTDQLPPLQGHGQSATRARLELDSESRDLLHQLVQYLRNNLPVV